MEAVKAFNNELYSLNEYKPPISKAKMTQITKSGIKAIKFYKHVVQSVEKFIQKCKPEYKVPGLYVIDSIVRQSRHQFGTEKDVFAPRFSKNIIPTFQHLYRCPSDDKSKIVRVLNLWQKNAVFKSDIIQPLLDMAAGIPPPSVTPVMSSSAAPVNNTTPGQSENTSLL
uniref:CID domain-containing protein n=1 Tax=Hippocampus comes TaxID=109280 RepID=A0A3Q2YZU6_HIPCM